MTDLLRQGAEWLEQQRAQYMASPVEYRRGVQVIPVQATFGKTRFEVEDSSGATVESQVWDFLILAADLALEPEPGDEIVAPSTGSGQATVYEVMNLSGEGCWRWSDPYRTTLRIHTREMGEA